MSSLQQQDTFLECFQIPYSLVGILNHLSVFLIDKCNSKSCRVTLNIKRVFIHAQDLCPATASLSFSALFDSLQLSEPRAKCDLIPSQI